MKILNFNLIDSLKDNCKKYLLNFDNACGEIYISKAFVGLDTSGRHRGLGDVYIKHNLFHQSNLRRDVEVQNTHIVPFKSPREVMQVTTINTQFGLGSELVDEY